MGFGLLFFGHLFLADFPYAGIDVFPDAAGYALMLIGLLSLRKYEKTFRFPLFAGLALLICSAFSAVFQILNFASVELPVFCTSFFPILLRIGEALYLILLFLSVAKIASKTGLGRLRARAWISVCLTGILLLVSSFFSIDSPSVEALAEKLNGAVYFSNVVYFLNLFKFIWNAALLFSCYRRICDEGENEPLPSGADKTALSGRKPKKSGKERK